MRTLLPVRRSRSVVERVLAHGGWELDDVQARHAANPDTFRLPSDEELAGLVPGTCARLIFTITDLADPVRDGTEPYGRAGRPNLVLGHERMWVWVEQASGETLVGVLQNLPAATHTRLVAGARVSFRRGDVIDVELAPPVTMEDELSAMAAVGFPVLDEAVTLVPEDPNRLPTVAPDQAAVCERFGVRPERPWAFSRCLVGRSVAPGTWPLFGFRALPVPERQDCGWNIGALHSDMRDADAADGFEVVDVADVRARRGDAWRYLALPPGWGFVLGADGYEDVYQDLEALEE